MTHLQLQNRTGMKGPVMSGIKDIDFKKLVAGIKPGELPVFIGSENSGKSVISPPPGTKPKAIVEESIIDNTDVVAANKKSLEEFITADDDEPEEDVQEEDVEDYKKIIEEQQGQIARGETLINRLRTENKIHTMRIARWEKTFDEQNLPPLLVIGSDVLSYTEAERLVQHYNADWFISAMLSQKGKVELAQAIFKAVDSILKGSRTNFIERLSKADPDTLDIVWRGSTTEETDEQE